MSVYPNNAPPPYPSDGFQSKDSKNNIGFVAPPYVPTAPSPQVPPFYGNQTLGNVESGFASPGFSDRKVRSRFVMRVYLILSVQMLFTFGISALFAFHKGVNNWVQRNTWFFYTSFAVYLVSYFALVCCQRVSRKFPLNYICLSVFTAAFSIMIGAITAQYDVKALSISMLLTFLIVLSVSFLAACTPIDFTKCAFFLAMFGLVFFIFGIVIMIVAFAFPTKIKVLHMVYCGIGVLLFSMYLAFDTQMVLGGKRIELSEEDYVTGALQLYVDVMNIFLYVLQLVNAVRND